MRSATVAALAAIAYVRLGDAVSFAKLGALDLAARPLAGEAPQLALIFTASCWWPALVALALLMLLLAWRRPEWRGRVAFAIPLTLIGWRLSDLCKDAFRRPRPEYWVLVRESSFAYSSGHAMFATIVYGLWAFFVWRSALPVPARAALAAVLAAWAAGVIWSRLALGAHYVTDLIGGVLLGVALLGLGRSIVLALPLLRSARR